MKTCNECHKEKPVTEFYVRDTGRPFGKCKVCTLKRKKAISEMRKQSKIKLTLGGV